MNSLQVFSHQQFGSIRTITEDGKTLFCAKDVATALGYKNTRDAIIRHCKGVVKRDGVSISTNQHGTTTEQVVKMAYIPEGDIYRLAARSELPGADAFESWIFDAVLPTIRKTGSYGDTCGITSKQLLMVAERTAAIMASNLLHEIIPLITNKGTDVVDAQSGTSLPAVHPIDFSSVKDAKPTTTPCKLETFPDSLRLQIDAMMEEMRAAQCLNFSHIARFCATKGYAISNPAVKRYYVRHFEQA